jgi:hypothetical protein
MHAVVLLLLDERVYSPLLQYIRSYINAQYASRPEGNLFHQDFVFISIMIFTRTLVRFPSRTLGDVVIVGRRCVVQCAVEE